MKASISGRTTTMNTESVKRNIVAHKTKAASEEQCNSPGNFKVVDNRPEGIIQRKLLKAASNSQQAVQLLLLKEKLNNMSMLRNAPGKTDTVNGADGIIQRNVIEEIGQAQEVAIVGESHGKYLDDEVGEKYRDAERAACALNNLDYRVEHNTIPVTLSNLLDTKPKSPPRHDITGRGEDTGELQKTGVIRPDDTLLRLGYFAPSVYEKLSQKDSNEDNNNNNDDPYVREHTIKSFRSELQNWDEAVTDSLLPPQEIKKLKAEEAEAFLVCSQASFDYKTVSEKYLPIVGKVIELYKTGVPNSVKSDALTVARHKNQTAPDDIASTQRSIWMLSIIARWAAKIKPTVFKVGGEHVDDMKTAMQLPTSIPSNIRNVRLVTDQEAVGQFEEAHPEPFEEIEELLAKRKSSVTTKKPKGPSGRKPPSRAKLKKKE